VAGDGFFFADGVDGFAGFAFDVDLGFGDLKELGEAFDHGGFVGGEFGFLGEDDDVGVEDVVAGFGEFFHGGSEEFGGVDVFVLGVGVGEELADVGEAGGAGEGVDEGVEDDVGIGVAVEALGVGDGDVREDEGPSGGGAVEVVAEADANVGHVGSNAALQIAPKGLALIARGDQREPLERD